MDRNTDRERMRRMLEKTTTDTSARSVLHVAAVRAIDRLIEGLI